MNFGNCISCRVKREASALPTKSKGFFSATFTNVAFKWKLCLHFSVLFQHSMQCIFWKINQLKAKLREVLPSEKTVKLWEFNYLGCKEEEGEVTTLWENSWILRFLKRHNFDCRSRFKTGKSVCWYTFNLGRQKFAKNA